MINISDNLFNSSFAVFTSILTVVISGFSFSILSLYYAVTGGVSFGYLFSTQTFALLDIIRLLLYLLAMIFALAGSFIVTKMEIRIISRLLSRNLGEIPSKVKVPLKDIILTLVIIIVLLIVLSLL